MVSRNALYFFFFLVLTSSVQSRFITLPSYSSSSSSSSSSVPTSDGIHNSDESPPILLNNSSFSLLKTCERTYGFMPWRTTAIGNLFFVIVYGYLMFFAARILSTESELLLEILGPGIVGGLFLPMIGAFPDAMLILVSGLSASKETGQNQVMVGMGVLAGSTVMLLTILWGSCVILGKCDLDDSTAKDLQDTKRLSLTGSGITVDIWTKYASRIMVISVIPYIIVQLPEIFHLSSSGRRLAILISLIVAVALLLCYCLYQVFQPWIQKRKHAYAKHKHVTSEILRHLNMLEKLLTDDFRPNAEAIRKLFRIIDLDGDTLLSPSEVGALITGIQFEDILDQEDAAQKVLLYFDTSGDGFIDEEEFVQGIIQWISDSKRSFFHVRKPLHKVSFIDEFHQKPCGTFWIFFKLLLGIVIAATFADRLVDFVYNFSTAINIPPFFISFIALPLATHSHEAVFALIFARRKQKRTYSLTFSEIYSKVTMNNILCLAVFLAVVYTRHLTWDFSAEVLVILIVCIVMGLYTSFHTTFPLWTSSVAYVLYPISLVLVYVLDYVYG